MQEHNDELDIDYKQLMEELIEEDKFFTKLVDTIPAKMYFDQDIQEKITAEKHAVMNNTVADLKKKYNQPELSAKNKHKRARLDPFFQKSVSQVQQELDKKHKKLKNKKNQSVFFARAANIEELQRRLQEKINMFQTKRKALCSPAKDKKRLKQATKKTKQKGNLKKTSSEIDTKQISSINKDANKSDSKPIYNKEGKIIYSKFDFSENDTVDTKKNHPKREKPKQLLKKAVKKIEEIENLKHINPEKAELVVEKEKWKKAIQKSEGVKIKDDPKLLKKSLKKEEKKKKKSAKGWKERTEHIEMKGKARQEKRARNIKLRKEEKLNHKIKRAKKKGRVVLN